MNSPAPARLFRPIDSTQCQPASISRSRRNRTGGHGARLASVVGRASSVVGRAATASAIRTGVLRRYTRLARAALRSSSALARAAGSQRATPCARARAGGSVLHAPAVAARKRLEEIMERGLASVGVGRRVPERLGALRGAVSSNPGRRGAGIRKGSRPRCSISTTDRLRAPEAPSRQVAPESCQVEVP